MRPLSRLVLLGSTWLLMGAACDGLRVPAPPSESVGATPAPPPAAAPPPPAPAPRRVAKADPAVEAQRLDQVRRGLRRLVVAEETYYAENGVYTEDLKRIGFNPERDTQVRFLWLSRDGWAAHAVHTGVPGRNCIIHVGRARGSMKSVPNLRLGREGVPTCDTPPAPRRAPAARAPAVAAAAESPTPGPAVSAEADTTSALDALDPVIQMRVDLRNLTRAQESWVGNQGTYSRRVEPFALQFLWHRGVRVTILSADDASWAAMATHTSRPGRSCVLWVGPVTKRPATEAQGRVPDQPAVPVCDD